MEDAQAVYTLVLGWVLSTVVSGWSVCYHREVAGFFCLLFPDLVFVSDFSYTQFLPHRPRILFPNMLNLILKDEYPMSDLFIIHIAGIATLYALKRLCKNECRAISDIENCSTSPAICIWQNVLCKPYYIVGLLYTTKRL